MSLWEISFVIIVVGIGFLLSSLFGKKKKKEDFFEKFEELEEDE